MAKLIYKSAPYVAMIFLQFGYAGMNIINKVSLNRGTSHFVLVVYRQAVATVVISPIAFFLERYSCMSLHISHFMSLYMQMKLSFLEEINIIRLSDSCSRDTVFANIMHLANHESSD